MTTILAVGIVMKLVAALWIICALVLILAVLIQKGRGGGLGAAFSGGMASNILGSRTGDFLTWVTVMLVGVFITLSVLMAKYYKPTPSSYGNEIPATTEAVEPEDANLPQG